MTATSFELSLEHERVCTLLQLDEDDATVGYDINPLCELTKLISLIV